MERKKKIYLIKKEWLKVNHSKYKQKYKNYNIYTQTHKTSGFGKEYIKEI